MGLNIARKLDFLMRLTGTQNSTLGRALSFDASYVSRLRSGQRTLSRNRDLILPLAAYFSRNASRDGQKAALAKRICPNVPWPESLEERTKLLARWLADPQNPMEEDDFDLLDVDIKESLNIVHHHGNPLPGSPIEFSYGNAGKRQSVEKFLTEIYEMDHPPTLLLHTDESMEWLYEDPDFVKTWAKLLVGIVEKGGKIKVIHAIRRSIEEMMKAIKEWVPIYMAGIIETYYCPRLRDNIYHRTLFIAQQHSALLSHSIANTRKTMVNMLLHEKSAVNALEDEFYDYLALCRPLIRIFNIRNVENFLHTYSEFTKVDDNTIMLRSIPSRCTMPESVNKSMAERIKHAIFEKETTRLCARFESHLAHGYHVTEILYLKDPAIVRNSPTPLPFRDLLGQPELHYTLPELCQHLEAIIELLEHLENYHVILSFQKNIISAPVNYMTPFDLSVPHMENLMLMAKEHTGVLMHNAGRNTVAFFSNETDVTLSFWDYLSRLSERENRQETIAQLREYIRELSHG